VYSTPSNTKVPSNSMPGQRTVTPLSAMYASHGPSVLPAHWHVSTRPVRPEAVI